jgi:hypothetical protein
MSKFRKGRRDGRRLFYAAAPAEQVRRHVPADLLARCAPGACAGCGRELLTLGADFQWAAAAAAALGLALVLTCTGCAGAARAEGGRPAAAVLLQDEAVAARLRQHAAEKN